MAYAADPRKILDDMRPKTVLAGFKIDNQGHLFGTSKPVDYLGPDDFARADVFYADDCFLK